MEEREKLVSKLEEIKNSQLLKLPESSSMIPTEWIEFAEKKQKAPEAIGSSSATRQSEEITSEAAIISQTQPEQSIVNNQQWVP